VKRKRLLATAAIGLAVAALSVSSASADPSGPPQYRTLAGVGSDTIQAVEGALANQIVDGTNTKILGSYDATGTATISTKAAAACQNMPRPNGSGAGRTALVNSLQAGDGCVQYARSSSLDTSATPPGTQLTYVPFAVDAVSYAVSTPSNVPGQLTLNDVKAIYHCDPNYVGTGPNYSIHPLLPQSGSGTRKFWESTVGILDTDVVNNVYPCISDKHNGVAIEEHDGRVLDANSLVPFSIAQYVAQSSGTIADLRGSAKLGVVDGLTPVTLNGGFGVTREVYNVIPTAQVGTAPYSTVFVGPNSAFCQAKTTIQQYGFALATDCGDTSKHN
jgi:ABC-type phosphate transport system substrate-binding protein